LFLRSQRKRLRNLRCRRDALLPFQLLDSPLRRVQLPLQGHDQFDQPINRDSSRTNVFLELLNVHAAFIADFPKSGSASFREWTATQGPPLRGRLLLVEDEPDIQRVIRLLLRKTDLEVDVAATGQMACDLA